ncbi:helix-turn-helix domain-containing protein [Peribacillus sp. SCS-26]|uniref:helix-turn-helix domain-containing protein n=1 Tax=Paraperibacillus marinus TaxID=3115295 RepID=UPI003905B5B2
MIEDNLSNLGESIYNIRVKLNISQKELADGICSQSQISKIESGMISPYVHTLIKISKKLGINPAFFLNQIYKDQFEFVDHSKKLVREAIHHKEYKEVKRLLKSLDRHPSFKDIEEKQFIMWHQGIITYYLDKDFHKSIDLLSNASKMKESFRHSEQDIQVLNSLAIIYSEEKQVEKAKENFELALKTYKNSLLVTDTSIYIRICYNSSKFLFSLNKYSDALTYCDRGIEHCKQFHSTFLLGELLYQKGSTLIKLNDKENGIKFLEQACVLFQVLDRSDYLNIVQAELDEIKYP